MKAAVENLTKSLALELGARGIRVNCIAPDVIPTPGTGPIEARTPLARAGRHDDVAGAALFLASDLSRFVSGATLHVALPKPGQELDSAADVHRAWVAYETARQVGGTAWAAFVPEEEGRSDDRLEDR